LTDRSIGDAVGIQSRFIDPGLNWRRTAYRSAGLAMRIRNIALGLLTSCAAGALAASALADPPERVGRISYVEGEVSFQPPQEDAWTSATRNFPVATGEAFWTGDEGRVELQVGPLEARLDNETELDVVDLDYGSTRLSLDQGSVDLRLWRVPRGGVTLATPAGDIRLDDAGSYRIDVGAPPDDGSYPPVEVTVFDGAAEAPSPDGLVSVQSGEAAMIYAGYDPQAVDAQDAAIDDWARDREARERWDQNRLPVAMTGAEDLDAYGQYEDTPDYGQVWYPSNVDPDWAPYRNGHWAYVQPWGWTWIDDQPWGFAPFHYGRWVQIDGRWGWAPGRSEAEPVYAPALVAFIGGGGWGIGLEGGGTAMGWVPLAPDEPYRPDYEVSERYTRRINAASVNPAVLGNLAAGAERRDSAAQFRNARAAVVVRSDAFARGAPVQRAAMPVAPQALASAPVASPASRPAPTPQARAGVGLAAPPGVPSRPAFTAPPPPARLQSFRAAVAAHPAGTMAPPAIPGVSTAPPQSRPGAPAFVAPSQIRNPAAQARQPAPVARPTTLPTPSTAGAPPRGVPLRSLQRPPLDRGPAQTFARPPQPGPQPGYAPQQEGASPPRRLQRPQQPEGQPGYAPAPQEGAAQPPRRLQRPQQPEGQPGYAPAPQEGTAPPPRRLQRPQQPEPQTAPGSQPGPDARDMRTMRRQAEQPASQAGNESAPQPQSQPSRRPPGGSPAAAPPENKPSPPPDKPKKRIGPDGKPIPPDRQ
jgi:hypothetical protein